MKFQGQFARKMCARWSIFFFLVCVSVIAQLSYAGRASIYPCPGSKSAQGSGVECTHVKLPRNLCTACPLRDPQSDGKFKDCSDIYNPNSGQCKSELQKYVDANPCDHKRRDAVNDFRNGRPSFNSRRTVEYVCFITIILFYTLYPLTHPELFRFQ